MTRKTKSDERLVSVAIMRNGEVIDRGYRSHTALRLALDPDLWDPSVTVDGDVEGFMTSTGRFVDREEAKDVAADSRQIHESWRNLNRPLLSSDVGW